MEKRELTCIGCPLGCSITVTMEMQKFLMLPATPANAAMLMPVRKLPIQPES